jgi:hypothetical protein
MRNLETTEREKRREKVRKSIKEREKENVSSALQVILTYIC